MPRHIPLHLNLSHQEALPRVESLLAGVPEELLGNDRMVQVNYDAKSDVLSIILAPKKVKESAEILPDVIADFDDNGRVVAFKILDASEVIAPGTVGTSGGGGN